MHRNSARITAGGQPVRWLGANFWSRTGGPLMWRSYDPAVVREELRVLRAHGLTDDQVVLFLARLHAGAGRHRREDDRPVRRLPRPARRAADEHGAHVHRRAHVRAELGPALAGRPRPVRRRVDGRAAGLVRRGDGAPVRLAPGRGRLAGLQRDAAVRRRPGGARDRRGVGADRAGRGARGRRAPAVLARRRRLGHRGDRAGKRVPARRRRPAVRLPRPARVPGG